MMTKKEMTLKVEADLKNEDNFQQVEKYERIMQQTEGTDNATYFLSYYKSNYYKSLLRKERESAFTFLKLINEEIKKKWMSEMTEAYTKVTREE